MKNKILCATKNISFIVCLISLFLFASCVTTPKDFTPSKAAKIAVVLGAGASKGFAHIGVLKVLESHKVPVHIVVGTSVGSFVGSLYAYGYNPYELQTIALGIQKNDIADYIIPDNGFIKGEKLENFVNVKVKYTPMEKFKIPFYAVATNIQNGEEMIFGRGNPGKAVRASCSLPGIFNPVLIGDKYYVDGGVVNPLAADVARRFGADVVIAVDISSSVETPPPKATVDTIMQAVDIMYNKIASLHLKHSDIVIRPKVGHIGSSDFSKRHEAIMEGEKAATEAMPAINQIMEKLRWEGRLPH
ncbi:MAG: patatin-like phospholipase family protein [Syntrophaceae bacterium]|nr:patatin-like phospholipase family protein [Syntrophaceae bacterium]